MKLVVIDTGVFVAGVFWRHEPHLCLKAWLCGIVVPVLTQDIFAEYDVVLERLKVQEGFQTDTTFWLETLRQSALWVAQSPWAKRSVAIATMINSSRQLLPRVP